MQFSITSLKVLKSSLWGLITSKSSYCNVWSSKSFYENSVRTLQTTFYKFNTEIGRHPAMPFIVMRFKEKKMLRCVFGFLRLCQTPMINLFLKYYHGCLGVCSSDNMAAIYFLRISKVWNILHHGSVWRVHKKMFLNVFIYFLAFLLFFIIKFVFLSFSFLSLIKYQISATTY